jgi:transmembrane sensor
MTPTMDSRAINNREGAESMAAAWIARRERDDWSASDEAELDAWIRAATDNRVAWLRLNTAWQQTNRLRSVTTSAPRGTVPAPDQIRVPFYDSRNDKHVAPAHAVTAVGKEVSSTRRSNAALAALAASLMLVIVGATAWYLWPSGPSYHTDIGALQVVPLSEGSRVTLNTDSEIRLAVTQKERGVTLERGEAFFEVAKDPNRPFVVTAGSKRIIAVGTKFSVRRENDEVRVFVAEGKVRVEGEGRRANGETLQAGDEGGKAILAAGSIARANDDSVLVQEKSIAEVEQLLTWRTGHLAFDKTPLADAIAEFNRYNKRKIVIQDPAVAAIRVGGNFRATNVEGFVRLIASDLPVTATQRGDEIVLTGSASP